MWALQAAQGSSDQLRGRGGWSGGELEEAKFKASFPAIQGAIKITGDGNGMRIQLDIPETELGNAAALLLWRQKVLDVTVRPEGVEQKDDSEWHEV